MQRATKIPDFQPIFNILLPKCVCLRGSASDPTGGFPAPPASKRWVSPLQRAPQNCGPQPRAPRPQDPPLHTDPLFSKLKLLKLDDLYKHQLGIYMYKSTKGLLPDSMSSMVIPIHNVHDHNLRNQNGYYIQHVRTNCRKFTIHYTGPVFWNTLPEQLREAVSENQFKRKLKDFLLSRY